MNRGLIAERCKQLGLDPHALARRASVDPFFLVDPLGLRAAAGLPVGLLQFLSRTLGLEFDEILTGPHRELEDLGDDLRLEAAFGVAGTLGRDDIAHTFGWTLDRAERALGALEARLRPTGTRLYHVGANRYRLGPALSALSRHDQQRIRRRQCHRWGLGTEDAGVLRLIIGGWADKRHWTHPDSRLVIERLEGAGLIGDRGDRYVESAEVRFSLRLDEKF